MSEISNVHRSLARINDQIGTLTNHRDRTMLEIYRDHWWAEVHNDVEAIMATLPPDTVSYLIEGTRLFFKERFAFTDTSSARKLYEGAVGSLPMAGPFEQERFAFADWGMTFEGILTAIVRGASLHGLEHKLDADALYMISWRTATVHPMDPERRLMLGEHVYTGDVVGLALADDDVLRQMYQEPPIQNAVG